MEGPCPVCRTHLLRLSATDCSTGTTAITSDQSSPASFYLHLNDSHANHVGQSSSTFLQPFAQHGDADSHRSSKSTFEHFVESPPGEASPSPSLAPSGQTAGSKKRPGIRQRVNSFVRRKSAVHHTSDPDGAMVSFPSGDSEDSTSGKSAHHPHGERNRVRSMLQKLTPSKGHSFRRASASSMSSHTLASPSPPGSPHSPSPSATAEFLSTAIPSGGRL